MKFVCAWALAGLIFGVGCGVRSERLQHGSGSKLTSEDDKPRPEQVPITSPVTPQTIEKTEGSIETKINDTVSVPVPVSGTFLVAKVINEESVFVDSIRIGLAIYDGGKRVNINDANLAVQYDITTIAPLGHAMLFVDPIGSPNFDRVLVLKAPTLAEARAAYPSILVSYKLQNKLSNTASALSSSLADMLGQ